MKSKVKYHVVYKGKLPVKCSNCRSKISYSDNYDAYYCNSCNEWLEETCGDNFCNYCKYRPLNPLSKEIRRPIKIRTRSKKNIFKDKLELIGQIDIP